MSDTIDIKPIKDTLEKQSTIFVLFGSHATVDSVAASLGLFLALKNADHEVTIASPTELRTEFSRLVGLNQVGKRIGNRNLVIAFTNYNPGSIEKIAHNDGQDNHFELVIQPKSGHKSPNPKDIEFSYRGAYADLIFLIGVNRLEDLGSLYDAERKLFSDATTVSFSRRQNPTYSAISVVDSTASSYSEMVAEFIEQLELNFPDEAASNLLAGIDFATNRFQNPVISPGAFIAAGKLLQKGAKRQTPRITSASQITGLVPTPFSTPQTQKALPDSQIPPFLPQLKLPPQKPVSTPDARPQTSPSNQPDQPDDQKPPKDWLEPKIFKGGTRV